MRLTVALTRSRIIRSRVVLCIAAVFCAVVANVVVLAEVLFSRLSLFAKLVVEKVVFLLAEFFEVRVSALNVAAFCIFTRGEALGTKV